MLYITASARYDFLPVALFLVKVVMLSKLLVVFAFYLTTPQLHPALKARLVIQTVRNFRTKCPTEQFGLEISSTPRITRSHRELDFDTDVSNSIR